MGRSTPRVLAASRLPTEAILLRTYLEPLGDPAGFGIVISALALERLAGLAAGRLPQR